MSNENLKIWDAVKSVDQKKIKQANIGGQSMLSVNGIDMVQAITAALGPIGKSWDYSIREERYENTKPMMRGQEFIIVDGATLWEQTHTIIIDFNINHGDCWRSFQNFGHTPYRYMTKSGAIMVDQEVGKKSLTDALKKCLTLLGVAADVYSGALDDHLYAAEAQDKIEVQRADENAEKQAAMISEMREALERSLKIIGDGPYEVAAKMMRVQLGWFANRAASINPQVKKAAEHAISRIQSELEAKKAESEAEKGEQK